MYSIVPKPLLSTIHSVPGWAGSWWTFVWIPFLSFSLPLFLALISKLSPSRLFETLDGSRFANGTTFNSSGQVDARQINVNKERLLICLRAYLYVAYQLKLTRRLVRVVAIHRCSATCLPISNNNNNNNNHCTDRSSSKSRSSAEKWLVITTTLVFVS